MPKNVQESLPAEVWMCEMERTLLVGVQVESCGMGTVNCALAAPMKVALMPDWRGVGEAEVKGMVARTERTGRRDAREYISAGVVLGLG
jgi:hypothetical protein